MIHYFESFQGPTVETAARDDRITSEFILGTSNALILATPNGGSFSFYNSAGRARIASKRRIEPANVLVIGHSMEYFQSGTSTGFEISCIAFTPGKFSEIQNAVAVDSSWSTLSTMTADQLPVLVVNPYKGSGATTPGVSLRTRTGGAPAAAADVLWNESLPGVNFYQKHFYEVVYDFVNNKIEAWVDNILVGTLNYTFSAVQKSMAIRLRLDLGSWYNSSTSVCRPILNGMYAATERLGPVSWGLSKPTADAEVSAEFTTLPGWSKVNQRQDGVLQGARITTTKSKQKALFKGSTVTGDILGISMRGRYSATEQSALEASGAVKPTIKSNGQEVQQDAIAVPKQSFITPITLIEKSPFTGVAWTAAELTAMTYGAEIVVTPKVVS